MQARLFSSVKINSGEQHASCYCDLITVSSFFHYWQTFSGNLLPDLADILNWLDPRRHLVGLLAQNKLSPVIDRTYPLDQAPQAFSRLSEGRQFGKILLLRDS